MVVKCNLEGKKGRKGKIVDKNYEKVHMCKGLRGCGDKNNKPKQQPLLKPAIVCDL